MKHTQPNRSASRRAWLLWATLCTAVICVAYGAGLSVPVIADETVTMANGAELAGYHWSYMVGATGHYYYKYAQAVLATPFFLLCQDGGWVYRLTMVFHGLLQASIVPVVYLICVRYLGIASQKLAALLGMVTCFVPSVLLYAYYNRGDVLLPILPWYVLALLLESRRAYQAGERRTRWICSAAAAWLSCLCYMAHTRGVVLLIAVGMTVVALLVIWRERTIHIPVFCIAAGVGLVVDQLASNYFLATTYAVGGAGANTLSYEGTERLLSFTLGSLKSMLVEGAGWCFTLICSTYGLALIGGLVGVTALFRLLGKKEGEARTERIVLLFGLLVFAGFFLVGAIFFKGTYTAFTEGGMVRRSDKLIYDRYAVCGLPFLVFYGCYALAVRTKWLTKGVKTVSVALFLSIFLVFLTKSAGYLAKYSGYLYNTIILGTFQTVSDPWDIIYGATYSLTGLYASAALAAAGMLVLLALSGRVKGRGVALLLAGILVGELALCQVNYCKVRKATDEVVKTSTVQVVDYILTLDETLGESPYILETGEQAVPMQFYQGQLLANQMFADWQEAPVDSYLVICSKEEWSQLADQDCYFFADFDYEQATEDVVYVKGQALKERLEDAGYRFTS